VTARILATVALGMALGGESALAGIAGAGAAPGGLVGNAVASLASGRGVTRAARWLGRTASHRGKSFAEAAAALGGGRTAPMPPAAADPARSVAAQRPRSRPSAPSPAPNIRRGGDRGTALAYGGVTGSGLRTLLERQRDQLSPGALGQAKTLERLRAQPPLRSVPAAQRDAALRERAGLQARLFELRAQETRDPAPRAAILRRSVRYAEIAHTGHVPAPAALAQGREQRHVAYRQVLAAHLAQQGTSAATPRHDPHTPMSRHWADLAPEMRRELALRARGDGQRIGSGLADS
jgi:hypothetical protein